MTKDPICGMTVDEASPLHAERDGPTFYFCGDRVVTRDSFLIDAETGLSSAALPALTLPPPPPP